MASDRAGEESGSVRCSIVRRWEECFERTVLATSEGRPNIAAAAAARTVAAYDLDTSRARSRYPFRGTFSHFRVISPG